MKKVVILVGLLVSLGPTGAAAVLEADGQSNALGATVNNNDGVSINVTTNPTNPSVAEPTRFDVTVKTRYSDVDVEKIEITNPQTGSTYELVEFTGRDKITLDSGEKRTIPVTTTFDEVGATQVVVRVEYDTGGQTSDTMKAFEIVDVYDGRPHVNVDVDDPLVSQEYSSVNVTVTNVQSSALRDLRLELGGENVEVRDSSRVLSTMEAGAEHTFEFRVKALETTEAELEAELSVAMANGNMIVRDTASQEVEERQVSVPIEYTVEHSEEAARLDVQILNRGNIDLDDVLVQIKSSGEVTNREFVGELAIEEQRTVRFNLSNVTGDLEIEVEYDTEKGQESVSKRVPASKVSSRIEPTSIEISPHEGDTVHISGQVSNIGLVDADAVMVEVVDTEDVTPAQPAKQYFIGTIPASGFVSFNLYATVGSDATTIPIDVKYIQNGVEYTERHEISVNEPQSASQSSDRLLVLVGGLISLVFVGVLVFAISRTI